MVASISNGFGIMQEVRVSIVRVIMLRDILFLQ